MVFRSVVGHQAATEDTGDVIAEYVNAGPDVPPAGDQTPRINLGLRQGLVPTDRQAVEVIIRHFEFEPL